MFLCIFTIFSYFLSKKEQRKTKNNHYISKKSTQKYNDYRQNTNFSSIISIFFYIFRE